MRKSITFALATIMAVSSASASMADSTRGHDDRYYQNSVDSRIETYEKLGRTNDDYKKDKDQHRVKRKTGTYFGRFLGGIAIGVAADSLIDR